MRHKNDRHIDNRVAGEEPRTQSRQQWNVSQEDFVRIWQSSANLDEFHKRTHMPKHIASARAAAYRDAGVKLKHMRRDTKRSIKVKDLNKIIQGINKELGIEDNSKAPEGNETQADDNIMRNRVRATLRELLKTSDN
jgi:hypothetical protein